MFPLQPRINPRYQPFVAEPGVFTPAECSAIIAAAGDFRPALIGGDDEPIVDPAFRRADVAELEWTPDRTWILERLEACALRANEAAFGYDISAFFERPWVIRYGVGGQYRWHIDLGPDVLTTRKLTMVVQLSDPADYEGGRLALHEAIACGGHAPQGQGDAVVFPAWALHQVESVRSGTRFSLIAWVGGPPLR